jgi:hypothetical protein
MKRGRGRPRLDPTDRSVAVNLRLSAATYDKLFTRARIEGTSVPELVRRALRGNDRSQR